MERIPLCIPALGDEEVNAVEEVLRNGWLAHGPKNHEFEELFQKHLNVKHAITMNSCTSALHIALEALNIQGEVITPSFTWVATVNAIILAGATPIFVDIDKNTRNISPQAIETAITDKTEAIMVVHYGGLPADMPAIIKIAQKHNLRLIEDSAECLGATYNDIQVGTYDMGCFSFFPTKNITTGEGGMFTTNDDALARRIRTLIAHGIDSTTFAREKAEKPWLRIASQYGYNFRMSNVLAAIGAEQMKKLNTLNAARQHIANCYIQRLSKNAQIGLHHIPKGFTHSWQMFTILVPQNVRDPLLAHLREQQIEASVHFDPPVHQQEPYHDIYQATPLDNTNLVSASLITLPIFPTMTENQVARVCDTLLSYPGLQ